MPHLFIAVTDGDDIMDEDDVIAISGYLLHGVYPEGFTRDDKRNLRQKARSFICEPGWYGFDTLILISCYEH